MSGHGQGRYSRFMCEYNLILRIHNAMMSGCINVCFLLTCDGYRLFIVCVHNGTTDFKNLHSNLNGMK